MRRFGTSPETGHKWLRRYAVGLAACGDDRTATVQQVLMASFQRHGLPRRLLVDNGAPVG